MVNSKRMLALLLMLTFLLGILPQRTYAVPKQDIHLNIIVTSVFKDPKFLAEVRSVLNKGPTDDIYSDDLKKITNLTVAGKGISDLAGINFFSELIYLRCDNNLLTTLDVHQCSKLKVLHCWANNLTSLNISKNTALMELYCDKNKLTTLDVSNSPNLEFLNCFTNELTKLKLGNTSKLTILFCYDNKLTELDVSKNKGLKELYCYKNKIKTLDVSKNTGLEVFNCSDNKLTKLDVSKNTKLHTLNCYNNEFTKLDVTKNKSLSVLRFQGNNLSTIDVSKNPELTRLNCGGNKFAKLSVNKNLKLVALNCMNNQLTALDLSKNTKLKELYCQGNYFSSKTVIKGLNESKLDVLEFNPQSSTPSAPENFNAKPGEEEVDLSWAMPVYGGTSAIKGFEVSSNDGGTWVDVGSATNYTFTNLTGAKEYVFKVRAINSAGKGLIATAKSTPKKAEAPKVQDVTLHFSTEGGSIIDSISKPPGTLINLEEYKPTREDYSFAGWYSEAEFVNIITSIKLEEDTTIYAKWSPLEDEPPEPEGPESDTEGQGETEDSGGNIWLYVSIGLAAFLCGAVVFIILLSRKKKHSLP